MESPLCCVILPIHGSELTRNDFYISKRCEMVLLTSTGTLPAFTVICKGLFTEHFSKMDRITQDWAFCTKKKCPDENAESCLRVTVTQKSVFGMLHVNMIWESAGVIVSLVSDIWIFQCRQCGERQSIPADPEMHHRYVFAA